MHDNSILTKPKGITHDPELYYAKKREELKRNLKIEVNHLVDKIEEQREKLQTRSGFDSLQEAQISQATADMEKSFCRNIDRSLENPERFTKRSNMYLQPSESSIPQISKDSINPSSVASMTQPCLKSITAPSILPKSSNRGIMNKFSIKTDEILLNSRGCDILTRSFNEHGAKGGQRKRLDIVEAAELIDTLHPGTWEDTYNRQQLLHTYTSMKNRQIREEKKNIDWKYMQNRYKRLQKYNLCSGDDVRVERSSSPNEFLLRPVSKYNPHPLNYLHMNNLSSGQEKSGEKERRDKKEGIEGINGTLTGVIQRMVDWRLEKASESPDHNAPFLIKKLQAIHAQNSPPPLPSPHPHPSRPTPPILTRAHKYLHQQSLFTHTVNHPRKDKSILSCNEGSPPLIAPSVIKISNDNIGMGDKGMKMNSMKKLKYYIKNTGKNRGDVSSLLRGYCGNDIRPRQSSNNSDNMVYSFIRK